MNTDTIHGTIVVTSTLSGYRAENSMGHWVRTDYKGKLTGTNIVASAAMRDRFVAAVLDRIAREC